MKNLAPLLLSVALAIAVGAGCDAEIRFKNVLPRITWVHVAPQQGHVSEITVWVQDYDGDPVDLSVEWRGGGDFAAIELAPGGYGLTGLSTRGGEFDDSGDPSDAGQPHAIAWQVPASAGGAVELRFRGDDGEAGTGEAACVGPFDPAAGLFDVDADTGSEGPVSVAPCE